MIKACIFDLDGTLTNTLNAIAHFGNTALSTHGFRTFPTERYKKFVGDGRTKLIEHMLDTQNALTAENYKKVCEKYDREYEAQPLYDTRPYDGIPELLAELKSRGIKTAVCSNKPDNVVNDVANTLFDADAFTCVYGVKEGGAVKPDPECALKIAQILDVEPSECLFIGDMNVDIFTARNTGMTSVGALWGFRDREELSAAGAAHIISEPREILRLI